MSHGRVINVECQCGFRLFKYYKSGHGRLIKVFLDNIRKDYAGILEDSQQAPLCPNCNKDIGDIQIINGRIALKLNQGTVRSIRV